MAIAARLLLGPAFCALVLNLQGCSDLKVENEELKKRIKVLEAEHGQDCQQKCNSSALYGRWSSATYGHHCMESTDFGPKATCRCSSSPTPPKDCKSDSVALLESGSRSGTRTASASENVASADSDADMSTQLATNVTVSASRAATVSRHRAAAKTATRGSPRDTVHNFCDAPGLADMHGTQYIEQEEGDGMSGANQLEAAILNDISKELETNNVDKMAKEIFTFYICVRWIPEGTFWEIAKQELAAELVQSIVDHEEDLDQAVAELYQGYKYVPLLCSKNLEVWGKTDEKHHTYFGQFREDVNGLAQWLDEKKNGMVNEALVRIDETFCGGKQMNSKACNTNLAFKDWLNDRTSWTGLSFDGKKNKWGVMQALFNSFEERKKSDTAWKKDIDDWKAKFPYHSFIDKPGGMPTDMSPTAEQRFLVCFGKRVASELHRRPNGQHIMTDQNNIGCHGWWNQEMAKDMLNRMVELWKPPTCQLAEMVYTMKKEILGMFVKMNERLFDALPTMLMDEELDEQNMLDAHMAGPGPYNPSSAHDGEFIDGMRVTALTDIGYDCEEGFLLDKCEHQLNAGQMGTVEIVDGTLHVVWGNDKKQVPRPAQPGQLHIMPHGWQGHKGVSAHLRDLVAGVTAIADKANAMFSSMFRTQYKGLSVMMSDSISKWIVCPVRDDADMDDLDNHLGVEDAAFQDFRKEAYSKWTGYEAKVPGEECRDPDFLKGDFGKGQVCDLSELHADHVEKYFDEDGEQEAFICPLKPDLRFDEQLTVLAEKKGTCFLRMTNEQARHYGWQYRGDFPARRQNDQMENPPRQEFELVKLLKVPEGINDNSVSYGRYCALDELLANPRFCEKPPTYNPWPTADEMASHLAGTVAGSLGVGAAALQGSIKAFQMNMSNISYSEVAGTAAKRIKETTLDGLFGTGRLLYRTGRFALAYMGDDLPGAQRRKKQLEEDMFGALEGGALLHRLSFQRVIGANGRSSNAKERFQRYVMSYPCGDFDPAMQFSIKREWGQVTRRLVREAWKQTKDIKVEGPHVLDYPEFEMLLRGEARVFEDTANQEKGNSTFFNLGASVQVTHLHDLPDVECRPGKWGAAVSGCEPADRCERDSLVNCRAKTVADPDSWMPVKDKLLAKTVGALDLTGGTLSSLKGIKFSLYCGEKKLFGREPGVGPNGTENLLSCLKRGVKQNAQLRAKEPWKLYFKDEVVVVAVLDEILGRWCAPEGNIPEDVRTVVCDGAAVDANLGVHVVDSQKRPVVGKQTAVYRGLHSGAGYPKGSPREVVLKPEDILEAVELLMPEGMTPKSREAGPQNSTSESQSEEELA